MFRKDINLAASMFCELAKGLAERLTGSLQPSRIGAPGCGIPSSKDHLCPRHAVTAAYPIVLRAASDGDDIGLAQQLRRAR